MADWAPVVAEIHEGNASRVAEMLCSRRDLPPWLAVTAAEELNAELFDTILAATEEPRHAALGVIAHMLDDAGQIGTERADDAVAIMRRASAEIGMPIMADADAGVRILKSVEDCSYVATCLADASTALRRRLLALAGTVFSRAVEERFDDWVSPSGHRPYWPTEPAAAIEMSREIAWRTLSIPCELGEGIGFWEFVDHERVCALVQSSAPQRNERELELAGIALGVLAVRHLRCSLGGDWVLADRSYFQNDHLVVRFADGSEVDPIILGRRWTKLFLRKPDDAYLRHYVGSRMRFARARPVDGG